MCTTVSTKLWIGFIIMNFISAVTAHILQLALPNNFKNYLHSHWGGGENTTQLVDISPQIINIFTHYNTNFFLKGLQV